MTPGRFILIHGWRVRDGGQGSIGLLEDPLRQLGADEVVRLSYGYVLDPFTTRHRSRQIAMEIAAQIRPGDILVGHSNGGRIAVEASYLSCISLGPMVLLQPALDASAVPSQCVPRCLVTYSRRDIATRLARWLPWSPWGAMGTVGYRPRARNGFGRDPRMVNLQHEGRHTPFAGRPHWWAEVVWGFATGQ